MEFQASVNHSDIDETTTINGQWKSDRMVR